MNVADISAHANRQRFRDRETTNGLEDSERAELEKLLSIDVMHQKASCASGGVYEVPSTSLSLPAKIGAETLVNMTITDRARRNKLLPPSLFADPAWDMLLELFRAELRQIRVSVSSLCGAAQVPSTTALRWIKIMEDRGLFTREADRLDGRRFYIRLTAAGSMAMTLYFSMHSAADARR